MYNNNENSDIINSNCNNNYNLILCELHYIGRHGKTSSSAPDIDGHYMVYDRFEPFTGLSYCNLEEYNEYDTDNEYETDDEYENENKLITLDNEIVFLKKQLSNNIYVGPHPIIRNYYNIVTREDYIKPEIAQCIVLPTEETIAILKTFWIRIIQRNWKKVFYNRKTIIKDYLYTREINQNSKLVLPGLKGMLANIAGL